MTGLSSLPWTGAGGVALCGRRAAVAAGCLCALFLVLLPVAAASAATSTVTVGSLQVPVLGQVTGVSLAYGAADRYAVFTVHGVRRVNGVTVLYFSIGIPEGSTGGIASGFNPAVSAWEPGFSEFLLDPARRVGYSVLKGGTGVVGSKRDLSTLEVGDATVRYTVFPQLPADTAVVDVQLGRSQVVHSVPVEDGPLLPTVGDPDGSPVPLGEGWPAIDPAAGTGANPASSTFPLDELSQTLDKSATTRRRASATTVDLSSDVLFAVDSAKLSPRAAKVVARMAKTLTQEAAPGAKVTVVGHTDSTGSPAHNLDLSKRRAQSVVAALEAQLKGVSFDSS